MDTYNILIIICSLIIYSYLSNIIAKHTKIPSVLLLLISGIALRYVTEYFQIKTLNFNLILPALGTIGLIMIVFEGALELDYHASKKILIAKALLSSFIILVLSCGFIACLFLYLTHQPFHTCLLNAIPFSVISSAVAIPSVTELPQPKREFIVYESSFSDILGIMFFNFMITNNTINIESFLFLGLETFEIFIIAMVSCLILLLLLRQLTYGVKYVLIIAIMILIYAIGRLWHLPSLIIVFAFGLFLKNVDLVPSQKFQKYFIDQRYHADMHQLQQISAESAFLLRTFFFIIFGFTIQLMDIADLELIKVGLVLIVITYTVRYVILKYLLKTFYRPEVYITPRGLISILLFYNIPNDFRILPYESGLLLFTVLATNIILSFGLVSFGNEKV